MVAVAEQARLERYEIILTSHSSAQKHLHLGLYLATPEEAGEVAITKTASGTAIGDYPRRS